MKKIILCLLVLAFNFSTAFARTPQKALAGETEETGTGAQDNGPLYIGLGTGADFPGSNWISDYLVGGGANGFIGYQLDKNLAIQLEGEEWFFTGSGTSLYNFRVLAEAKYTFEGKGWQPYLLAGPGLVIQTLSPTGDSTTNFDALGGLGVQFDLAPRTHFFVEAKYNFIMSATTTFTDLPISAGIWVGL